MCDFKFFIIVFQITFQNILYDLFKSQNVNYER